MLDNSPVPISTDVAPHRHRYLMWTAEHLRSKPDVLFPNEVWWRDHQLWLQESGYMLRPRYRPGWVASWNGTDKAWDAEDGVQSFYIDSLDAVRMVDNRPVMLKRLLSGLDSTADELAVHQFLQSDDLALHPDNHTALLLDVLQAPDGEMEHIVVLPLLRPHDDPEFETTAEVVDFIEQILKGLRFMHTNGVAHGGLSKGLSTMWNNVMMDATAMYPDGFHPGKTRMRPDMSGSAAYYSRSQRPVTYYFTDFRQAHRYTTGAPPLLPVPGEDRIEPEHEGPLLPRDPFAADIYSMGKLLQREFPNAHFVTPLVADMTKKDPAARPSIDEVVARFADICSTISPLQLALPIVRADKNPLDTVFRSLTVLGRVVGQALYGSIAF